jgi:serine/threonine-protein kinase RsbW
VADSLTIAARVTGPGDTAVCRRSYPGRAGQVPRVRAFVARVLDGCPAAGDAALLADELAANAVLHSHSGEPGGVFTVRVEVRDGISVCVGVGDEGGPAPPRLRTGDGGADGSSAHDHDSVAGGRGLRIVQALSDDWGVIGDVIGRTVWFRLGWGRR